MMVYVNECYVRSQHAVFVEPVIEAMRALTAEYRKATGQPTDCEVRHFIDNLIDETGGAAAIEKEGGEA